MYGIKDITGCKFGRLTAIKHVGSKNGYAVWLCKCDCGKEVTVKGHDLRKGSTKSCGCFNKESSTKRIVDLNTTHGGSHSRLFRIWTNMKTRCYNPNSINYKNYGERGITICDEWKISFEAFRNWSLENGYEDRLTIDRIDVNGDYCPENCRWATRTQQANNKRNNRIISYNGETHTMFEWAKIVGIDPDVLEKRLNSKNYTVERALTEPQNQRGKYKRNRL